jgi:serine/threonine protein kinase/Flp pilus assembly protein TadD
LSENISPGSTLGHYRVLSKLGAGGMGEVYLAQDTKLDRKVAIKFLHEEFSKDADKLNRFIQEAKAASALNHPNILTVYEIGEAGSSPTVKEGGHYIATEFIDGHTLREHLSQKEQLSLNQILKIGVQVSEALSAAHQAGIIHRDIKPENIMLRKDGYAKVLDFGLAKLSAPVATASSSGEDATRAFVKTNPGMVMGTVSYMSPEQARGKETDARTDIWSLGVVLYEMLSGKVPFTGETINHTIVSILEKEPLLLENVPAELQRIVRKAMTKDVEMRYQSARDLLIDLRNLRRDLDIQGELERSIVPNRETANASLENATQMYPADVVAATKSGRAAATQSLSTSSSSLEYAVTQAKSHKLATAIIGVLLVGVISTAGYFAFVSRSGSTKQISSIAVMPFVNESGNADLEYLSDGMTETLIKNLSQVPNLAVKSRSTVFYYKGKETSPKKIGEELGVQAVLLGRVSGRGDDLKLSLELVNTQTQDVIWAEQYDRKQSELVSLQSEIAKDVSTKLKIKLSGAEEAKVTKTSTADPEAYQAYLKGRYYWNRRTAENLRRAIEQFKIATDRDPNYALAFVGLADCYALLNEYSGVPTTAAAPQARVYAERAIAIDASLAEPHATLGTINRQLWQWAEAEKEFKRAIELNPNYATAYHWYSVTLLYLGRYDESLAMIQRAHELDPLSSIITATISWVQLSRNNPQASIENLLKLIELDPNFGFAYDNLGLSYLKTGRNAEAVAPLEKAAQLTNRYGVVLGNLGYVYAATGKRTKALAVIKELEEKYARKEANGLSIAAVYTGLGDKDKAFEWLEKDFQNRDGLLPDITVSIPLESLRNDPRFKDLLKRMNLPE